MKTMTIRNIPDDVARWLAGQADARQTSINQTTVSILASAAFPTPSRKRRDLSGLFGSWSRRDGERFDRIIEESFEQVNPADWENPR